MKKTKLTHKIAGLFTAGILMNISGASAQMEGGATSETNFTEITGNMTDSSSTLPNLITTTAYVGGIGLAVAGILKVKGHVDAPQQVPLKDGLVRLGAAGGMLALPLVLEAMAGSIGVGESAPNLTKIEALTYD